jgi:serine/threonine protein kinase
MAETVPFALPLGTLIAGYEIKRVLGAGGFGITYEGYNPVTKRKAAIKEFFPRGIASRDNATQVVYAQEESAIVTWALERFRRSTTELCDFKHPNIVPVLNYVPAHETGYMFMEQVEGETLEQWLREKGDKITFEEICAMIDPVCDALEYVHAKQFIHRDIAPDNIMIRKDGRPMLIDFGAIKIIAQQTQLRSGSGQKSFAVAKQHYSPPEQLDQEASLDPRADIYALGAVLYRAVTGNPPADADKRKNGVILKNVDSYIPAAKAARIALPAGAAETIDRALSLKPEKRQESIAEFRAALKGNVAETELVKATQLQRPDPMPTPGFTSPQAQPSAPANDGATKAAPRPPRRVSPSAAATAVAAAPVQPAAAANSQAATPAGGEYQMAPRRTNSWIGIGAGVVVALIVAVIAAASFFRPAVTTTPVQTQTKQQPPNTQQNTRPQRESERDTGTNPDTGPNNVPQKEIQIGDKETGE